MSRLGRLLPLAAVVAISLSPCDQHESEETEPVSADSTPEASSQKPDKSLPEAEFEVLAREIETSMRKQLEGQCASIHFKVIDGALADPSQPLGEPLKTTVQGKEIRPASSLMCFEPKVPLSPLKVCTEVYVAKQPGAEIVGGFSVSATCIVNEIGKESAQRLAPLMQQTGASDHVDFMRVFPPTEDTPPIPEQLRPFPGTSL